jgi:Fe-S-cluster containining protein
MSVRSINDIQDLYAEIDCAVAAFKLATGLRCLSQCGRCCPGAPVTASAVEMLPAALSLLASPEIEQWLERLAAPGSTCVAFSSVPLPETGGHCLIYRHRPTMCRLFGFAAVRNRRGNPEVSICRLIRQAFPEAAARAEALLADGGAAPLLAGYSQRLFGLDAAAHPMPINHALAQAVQRCGLAAALEAQASTEELPQTG